MKSIMNTNTEHPIAFKPLADLEQDRKDHANHIRGRLQDGLLYAPDDWSEERLEETEKRNMVRVEQETLRLPARYVATQPLLEKHVAAAIATMNAEIAAACMALS